MDIRQLLREEIEDAIQSQKDEILSFEKDPLEYILKKYPSLEATLTDLMTDSFRDYLTGIYIMAPKPTTFKVLLHNGQSFYLTYTPKAYIAKVSGKQYHLMNLKEEEYAIKAIANILLRGMPPGSEGPTEQVDDKSIAAPSTGGGGGGGSLNQSDFDVDTDLDNIDTTPDSTQPDAAPDTDTEEEPEELQEEKEKPVMKFRIKK